MLVIQAALSPGTFHTRQTVKMHHQTLPTRNAFTGQYSYVTPEGGVSDEATDLA
jgi:hypothetical protein